MDILNTDWTGNLKRKGEGKYNSSHIDVSWDRGKIFLYEVEWPKVSIIVDVGLDQVEGELDLWRLTDRADHSDQQNSFGFWKPQKIVIWYFLANINNDQSF